MKIAIVSAGLGNIWRGYERFSHELFHLVKDDLDITLFKGGGSLGIREVVIPNLRRDGAVRLWPLTLKDFPRWNPYYLEVFSFFLSLVPHLKRGNFDIVHFTDCPLANLFHHSKKFFGLRCKTIWTNGNPVIDQSCVKVDLLHQLTPWHVQSLIAYGIPEHKIAMVPFGVHAKKFESDIDAVQLKKRYGLPEHKRIILAVSAINRAHKRVDYLIDEVSRLGSDYFLLVAGHMEDSSLELEASRRLGGRFKFVHVPFGEVDLLYRLSDIFVMCSLDEGFGLAAVEAMFARIPLVLHQSPHNEWLTGDRRCLTDLSLGGALSRKITETFNQPTTTSEIVDRNYRHVRERFEWSILKEQYLDLYERVVGTQRHYKFANVPEPALSEEK